MKDKNRKIKQTIGHGVLVTTSLAGLVYGGYHIINELSRATKDVLEHAPDCTEGLAIGYLTFGLIATIPFVYGIKSAGVVLRNLDEMLQNNHNYEPVSLMDYISLDDD